MANNRPLILVCNDDGITAPGIRNLIEVVREMGEVVVVAPDSPQSGKGHGITIDGILRRSSRKLDDGPQVEHAISGTPVDCVKLAVNVILPRKPDIIVSGINHGSNSSINVIYSGTMSAAVEGSLENIPSVGFSLCDFDWDADFEPAKPYIRKIVKQVLDEGLPRGICLNVNIPRYTGEDYKGVKVCRQSLGNWEEEFDERHDPRGRDYYWLTGKFVNYDEGDDTDEWALENYYISVVPVNSDITAHQMLDKIKGWNI